jgi:hypothetical protein
MGAARTLLFVVWSTVCLIGAPALWSLPLLAGPHKVIDLRKVTDAGGEYEIGFCARPSPDAKLGLPGHAFVTFSHRARDGKRTFVAIGHSTSADIGAVLLSYLGPLGRVSGYLADEKYSSVMEKCLVVQVNETPYNNAVAMISDPLATMGLGPPGGPVLIAYKLGSEDCMSFMIKVAATLGPALKIPDRVAIETPLPYVRRFIDAN